MKKIDFQGIALNGGRFISQGKGRHKVRCLDSDELIYILSGHLEMFEGKHIFSLNPGEWVILRRGRTHGGLNNYPKNLSFFWLHFVDESGFLEFLPQRGRAVRAERLTNFCQSFLEEQQEPVPDAEIQRLLFALIIRELQRSGGLLEKSNQTRLAIAAQQLIKLKYTTAITPGTLSKELKCNAEYLGRIYHLQYGTSITQTINTLRVEYAARLLMESAASVKEILFQSGFNDPAYFRKQFFTRYAVTPSQFRQLYASGHFNSN